METCPICKGRRSLVSYACPGFHRIEQPCEVCDETGQVDRLIALAAADAQTRRDARVARGQTFAAAAAELGLTPREYRAYEVPYAAAMLAKGTPA